MDKSSGFDVSSHFKILANLYSESFEIQGISNAKYVEMLEFLEKEIKKAKPKKKKNYDEDENESQEENDEEMKEYMEIFKAKIIDYMLAAKQENVNKADFKAEFKSSENAEYAAKVSYSEEQKPKIMNLSYEDPVFFNNQLTYQRIFIDNSGKEKTVYELTLNAMVSKGMELETKHDKKLNTEYVVLIDGKRDGGSDKETGKRRYWEYWIIDKETGDERVGEESVYQQKIKKNEMIEWRLATEQESGCGGGGGPDPLTLANDQTVDKARLPAYVQNLLSMQTYNQLHNRSRVYHSNIF